MHRSICQVTFFHATTIMKYNFNTLKSRFRTHINPFTPDIARSKIDKFSKVTKH